MTIIHITADYPDSLNSAKTKAISNLVENTADVFDHQVYSLNREDISLFEFGLQMMRSGPREANARAINIQDGLQTWQYSAPSKGLFLNSILCKVADRIIKDIEQSGHDIALVQGHKLSIEAIIAERIARHFNVPFAITIQGNTDQKIIGIRRDLRSTYRRIFHEAAVVFPFAPWAFEYCEEVLGERSGSTVMLPCITEQDQILTPQICPPDLMTAFHLDHWRLKNLPNMVKAFGNIGRKYEDASFNIFGGASKEVTREVESKSGLLDIGSVKLCGKVRPADIQKTMNSHAGFVMPSRRESYGMVFAEALMAGCPIIYTKGTAVDGFFDDMPFAIAVPSNDVPAIGEAMERLLKDQKFLKSKLSEWQNSGAAAKFQKVNIAKAYRQGLDAALIDKISHPIS